MSFGPRFTVDVLACEPCRNRMRRQRWLHRTVNVVASAAAVLAALSLLQWYRGPFKPWLVAGVALVFLLPLFLWEVFFPRPFDMTAYSGTVDYEFRDADYAEEFAALNGDTEDE